MQFCLNYLHFCVLINRNIDVYGQLLDHIGIFRTPRGDKGIASKCHCTL